MIIDVSEHNGILNWDTIKPQIEAAIIRCGYGSDIVGQDDKQWQRNVSECERLGVPYGVYLYSYARSEDAARSEANHVLRLLSGHKPALPVFWDVEENSLKNLARKNFYAFSEVIGSKFRVGLYTGEYYYNTCMLGIAADVLWIAKYGTNNGNPQTAPVLGDGKKVHLWQYTSKAMGGHMDASQILDRGTLFGTSGAVKKPVSVIAQEVVNGLWGNGAERQQRLSAAGYNYADVQAMVNRLLAPQKKSVDEIAKEVLAGKWGNGNDRKNRLIAAGYDYSAVQAAVNKLSTPAKKSVDEIAREVIAGKWGNNPQRSAALRKAGYDPAQVQRRVNALL